MQENFDKIIAVHLYIPDYIERTLSKWFRLVLIVLKLLLNWQDIKLSVHLAYELSTVASIETPYEGEIQTAVRLLPMGQCIVFVIIEQPHYCFIIARLWFDHCSCRCTYECILLPA